MPDIFGIDLAGILADSLGSLVFDQTLIKVTSIRDPDDSSKRIKTKVSHIHKGFIDVYEDTFVNGGLVKMTDRKIVMLGATLPTGVVPEPGDQIIAEGRTFTIVADGVVRDPAGATYECQSN
ncbi:MAG: hypothetical protein JKY62_16815 [Desulfocapsa sp.]|nr:hypothetical protein [Desulfocapsa sp.]